MYIFTLMKQLLTLLCIVAAFTINAQERFPTNFDADSFTNAIANPLKWEKRLIAFKGTITETKKLKHGRLKLSVCFENKKCIDVGTISSGYNEVVIKNTEVKILGYFDKLESGDKRINASDEFPYHVIAFVIINLETQKLISHPGASKQLEIWMNGKIPPAHP